MNLKDFFNKWLGPSDITLGHAGADVPGLDKLLDDVTVPPMVLIRGVDGLWRELHVPGASALLLAQCVAKSAAHSRERGFDCNYVLIDRPAALLRELEKARAK